MCLPKAASCLQEPPVYSSHLSTVATCLQWPPVYSRHLSTVATCPQWPPVYSGHLSTVATCLQQPPVYRNHLSTAATCQQQPPVYSKHNNASLIRFYHTKMIILHKCTYHIHKNLASTNRINSHKFSLTCSRCLVEPSMLKTWVLSSGT